MQTDGESVWLVQQVSKCRHDPSQRASIRSQVGGIDLNRTESRARRRALLMTSIVIKLVVVALLMGTSAYAALGVANSAQAQGSGCTRDTECKGDRVCEAGQCVAPALSLGSTLGPEDSSYQTTDPAIGDDAAPSTTESATSDPSTQDEKVADGAVAAQPTAPMKAYDVTLSLGYVSPPGSLSGGSVFVGLTAAAGFLLRPGHALQAVGGVDLWETGTQQLVMGAAYKQGDSNAYLQAVVAAVRAFGNFGDAVGFHARLNAVFGMGGGWTLGIGHSITEYGGDPLYSFHYSLGF